MQSARKVAETLLQAGGQAYFVGGWVRDRLLGRPSHDVDLATDLPPQTVLALFKRAVPVGLRYGTVGVVTDEGLVEITTFRHEAGYADRRHPDRVAWGKTIEADLARRDFTINALAMDLNDHVVDPFNGQEDLRRGLVRAVGPAQARFAEDALRILRALRLAVELGFAVEGATWGALQASAPLLGQIAKERIWTELERGLASDAARMTHLLAQAGLVGRVMPWLEGVPEARLAPLLRVQPYSLPAYLALTFVIAGSRPSGRPLPWPRAVGKAVRQLDEAVRAMAELSEAERPTALRNFRLTHGPDLTEALAVALDAQQGLADWRQRCWQPLATALRAWEPSFVPSAAMRRLGLPPGPLVGQVVRAARQLAAMEPALADDADRLWELAWQCLQRGGEVRR